MNQSILAPAVRQLLWAVAAQPEKVAEVIPQAESWLLSSQESLRLLRPVVYLTPPLEEYLRQAQLDLEECQRQLSHLKKAPLEPQGNPELARSLSQGVERYLGQLASIQAEESKLASASPLLALDQLLRVGHNLLADRVEMFELQSRFPRVQGELAHLRSQWRLRQLLYPEISWPQSVEEGLTQCEAGLGAVAQFLSQGQDLALKDGLQLLARGSQVMSQGLYSCQELMLSKARYSRHDAVEGWLRLLAYPYDLGAEAHQQAWERLFQDLDCFQTRWQRSQRAGLGIASPELMEQVAQVQQQARDTLTALSHQALPPAQLAPILHPLWESLEQGRLAQDQALQELQESLAGGPRFLELLELLGQVQAGVLPGWLLKLELDQRWQQHQASLEALRQSEGQSPLVTVLESHQQAYQRLSLYPEDASEEHLRQGWKLIAVSAPSLIGYEQSLRQRVFKASKSNTQVICVRCGLSQGANRRCSHCSAMLPQVQVEEVQYQDITPGAAPPGPRSPWESLSELTQGLALGATSWEQVQAEVDRQLATLETTRQRFELDLNKILGQDQSLDSYCHFFVLRLGQLSQLLLSLQDAARARHFPLLRGAMDSYGPLHEQLQAFQNKIDQALKT